MAIELTDLVGRPVDAAPTPCLLLDRRAVVDNVRSMAAWADGRVRVRPHAKVHKCAQIARLQLDHGAAGLTTATVAEAEAMLPVGPGEILIANEVVGPQRARTLTEIARHCRVIVAIDDVANADGLSQAASAAGVEVGVLVDVDVGLHRCGVRSVEATLALAAAATDMPGLALRGVMGYEGHVVLIPDPAERAAAAAVAMDILGEHVDALVAGGFAVEIVSAGGTNTHDMTGLHPCVTELQAGTYAVMDTGYRAFAPRFRPSLTLVATVISRTDGTAVLDCGTKTVSVDVTPPTIPAAAGRVREVHEEHLLVDPAGPGSLPLGERVQVGVGYSGGTVNLHNAYVVVEDGAIVDVWPIVARGSGLGPSAGTRKERAR
jgi:D-serine deaminase-like pyridoxal phosphate-dependent protein